MLKNFAQTLHGAYATATFVVIVLLLFCPLLIVAPTLPLRRTIGRLAVRTWTAVSFVPLRVRGLAHLPDEPCVVVCNHASYIDGLLLTATLPARFTFMVQHGAADWPYVGLIVRRMGASFVNRDSAREAARAARELIDRIRAGESIAIFPEGTFRRAPELLPFQPGAFLIAARAGVPVVPSVIRGTRRLLGEGQKMLRWSRIEIEFLSPQRARDDGRDAADALRDTVRAVMLRQTGEADGTPVRLDETAVPEIGE